MAIITRAVIYIILNTQDGKMYIGQTVDFHKRRRKHKAELNGGRHVNQHLQRAWNKYGEKAFQFKTLEYCSVDQLDEREQHYLDLYMPRGLCYNVAKDVVSPARGVPVSEETRAKIVEARKHHPPASAETRQKMSEYAKNRPAEHRQKIAEANRNRSPETRQKLSEANKRRPPVSAETGRKISAALKGKKKPPISEETREKFRAIAKARPPMSEETRRKLGQTTKGIPRSEEVKRKISEAQKIRWAKRKADKTTTE